MMLIFKRQSGHMRSWYCAVLLVMCWFASFTQAQERETVDIAVLTEFPPEFSRNKDGDAVGFAIDILNEVLLGIDVKPNFIYYQRWYQVLNDAKRNKFDIIPSLGITEERQKFLYFSDTVVTHSLSAFVRSSDQSFHGIDQLNNHKVAVVSRNVAVPYAEEHISKAKFVIYESVGDALYHLLAGDVDVVIYPHSVFMKVAQAAGLENRIKVGQAKLREIKRSIAVTSDGRDLLPRINVELRKLKASPKYREIYNRWYGNDPVFWSVRKVIIVFIVAFMFIVAALLGWRFNTMSRLSTALSMEEKERKNRELALLESEKLRLQLQQQIQQAQRLEALGTLAGGIAHDFNNILQGIYVALTMVERKSLQASGDTDELAEPIRVARSFAEQGSELVKQIMSFSQQDDITKSKVDITRVIAKSCRMFKVTLPTNIELHFQSTDEAVVVSTNESQVNQIVSNLVTNAIHAMSKQRGRLEIFLNTVDVGANDVLNLKHGRYAKLKVSDTGIGIPEEVLPRIFDPFFTTKAPGEGVAMGLPVVHGIVKKMEGDIVVRSVEGKGTQFEVYLPMEAGDLEESRESSTQRSTADVTASGRILVVDDNRALLVSIKELLATEGYQVEAVTSPLDALALFEMNPNHFDLVMSDQAMPHMTGLELSAKILAIKPDIKLLLFTGYSERLDGAIERLGLSACLTKPVDPILLVETVSKLLS